MLFWLIISICLVVIFFGVVIGIFVCNQHLKKKRHYYWYEGDSLSIVCGVLGFLSLTSLIICICLYPEYNAEYTKHVADIMSISRDSGVEGHFTLGSGSVKSVQYYFYYYETDKGVKLGKIGSDNTYIIETNEYSPSIYEVKESHTFQHYYNLYVPYGTIITTYALN